MESFTEKDASSAYPSGGGRDGPSHKGGASADNNNNNNNNQAVFFSSKMEPVGAQAIVGVVVEDKSSASENIPGAVVASAVTDASVASPPRWVSRYQCVVCRHDDLLLLHVFFPRCCCFAFLYALWVCLLDAALLGVPFVYMSR